MIIVNQTHLPPGDPTKVDGVRIECDPLVVIHVTDVMGGFGVSEQRARYWQRRLDDPHHPDHGRNAPSFQPAHATVSTSALLALDDRLARWERYKRLPYHWIASCDGDVVRNHSRELRTHHGNGGNRGIGFAVDCGRFERPADRVIDAGRETLRRAVLDVWQSERPVTLAPHRSFSGQRLPDPGPIVWREVVLPVVRELPFARLDYTLAEAQGRPIPRSWDPNAIFDDNGDRIA